MYHSRKNDLVKYNTALIKTEGRTSWNKMELFEWTKERREGGRGEGEVSVMAICVPPSNPNLSAHSEMLHLVLGL